MAINPTPAIQLAGPVVMQIEGLWHLVVAAVMGLFAGMPLGAWFNAKGVTGVVADVKAEMVKVQADVKAIKAASAAQTSVAA
ncbi:MAG TPA: hypothetical protein VFV08_05860 [Puia sp.]|nr:hypothetical protein [Puia sp.]